MNNNLTAVEKRGNYFFKRDDYYKPYEWSPANGSKLRQCELLVGKNMEIAKNGIVTIASALSPQSVITATVAKANRIPCKALYGGTSTDSLLSKKYPSISRQLGADLIIASKSGFTSVLSSKASELAKNEKMFFVRYGFDMKNNLDVFLGTISEQVGNIPDIDNLVVTVGSGITLIGILVGIAMNGTRVKNVYGIGCAPNRVKKIRDYSELIEYETGIVLPIHLLRYVDAYSELNGYRYEQTVNESYEGITFHPRYEAKTFRWLRHSELDGETLMWITGSDF